MVGPLLQKCANYVPDTIVDTAENLRKTSIDENEFIEKLKKSEITKNFSTEETAKRIVARYCKIPQIWEELLPKLKGKYKLGIINNGMGITIPFFKQKNNFSEYFEIFLNSSEEKIAKPDSKIFLLACNKLKVKPEECVFIDDLERNVKGAVAVGMTGIVYKDYQNLILELKNLGII